MDPFLQSALAAARETKSLHIGRNILRDAPKVFESQFSNRPAILVTDANTFPIAGKQIEDAFRQAGHATLAPLVIDDPNLYAEYSYFEKILAALAKNDAIPIAVGAGTINDLTKLAAHRAGRQYLCVATAASMDGYTAFGASITHNGSKQTFDCPAPQAVLADLDVIAAAPQALNASGYADLLAKMTAGADWIVADALGVEAIDPRAWEMVQSRLREWTANPSAIARGDMTAIGHLVEGLMMGGFAMQWTRTSRVASGAEHQFSHLWDMQHHTHDGATPSHGFKVGIGTLAVARLYEFLYSQALDSLDPDQLASLYPDDAAMSIRIERTFDIPELRDKAHEETRAKAISRDALAAQLGRLREIWPGLRQKLIDHLLPSTELGQMLRDAGAAYESEQIGISRSRLCLSYYQAYCIRRRFTVLDLAVRTGTLNPAMNHLFA